MLRTALLALLALLATALAAAEPVTIVCLGDSITGGRPRQAYLHQYLKWSDLLQLAIEARAGTGAARVLNRGWAGDTTAGRPSGDPPGARNRLQADVIDEKPAVAVLLIGGNNFARVTEEERPAREAALRSDLTDMVQRLKAAGIRVLLLQYHEPFATDMAKVWTTLDDGNAVIAAVAAEQQVPTLALAPAFAAARAAGATPESLTDAKDGVHLAPYGEVVLARTVCAELVRLGWVP